MARSVDPFELFCWYYLGLSPQGEYRFVNGNQVAQIYNWTVNDLMDNLKKLKIEPDTVLNTNFPMARYQIDVQMAAGTRDAEQLLELASRIFGEFQQQRGNRRDWLDEIKREQEEDRHRRRS